MKIQITGIQISFESKEEFVQFVEALKQKAETFGLILELREKISEKKEEGEKKEEKKIVVV